MKLLIVRARVVFISCLLLVFLCSFIAVFTDANSMSAKAVDVAVENTQITLTSAESVKLEGGGSYKKGDSVTIKAQLKVGDKVFVAWKNNAQAVISTASTYTFNAQTSVEYSAVYESKIYNVNIDIQKPANNKSLAVCNVVVKDNGYILNYLATEVDSVFDGWYYNAKRVCDVVNYSMELNNVYLNAIKMVAKFRSVNTTPIRFVRDGNITVKTEYATNESANIVAPTAYKSGYIFDYWIKKSDKTIVKADEAVNVSGEETYEAVFIANKAPCKIKVINGTVDKLEVNAFDVVTATAFSALDFGYWTVNGDVVSHKSPYKFTVDCDLIVEAHAKTDNVFPSVALSQNTRMEKLNGKCVISPIAFFASDFKCEIMEKGLLLSAVEDFDVNLLTENVRKIPSFTKTEGQLTGTFTNLEKDKNYSARAYLVYNNSGNMFVSYSKNIIVKGIGDTIIAENSASLTHILNDATGGEIITLTGSNYAGQFTINQNVTLIGSGIDKTTIFGELIINKNAVIKNLTVNSNINGSSDTRLSKAVVINALVSKFDIVNCVITTRSPSENLSFACGVYSSGTNALNLTLLNSSIVGFDYGIFTKKDIGYSLNINNSVITCFGAIIVQSNKALVNVLSGSTLTGRNYNDKDYATIMVDSDSGINTNTGNIINIKESTITNLFNFKSNASIAEHLVEFKTNNNTLNVSDNSKLVDTRTLTTIEKSENVENIVDERILLLLYDGVKNEYSPTGNKFNVVNLDCIKTNLQNDAQTNWRTFNMGDNSTRVYKGLNSYTFKITEKGTYNFSFSSYSPAYDVYFSSGNFGYITSYHKCGYTSTITLELSASNYTIFIENISGQSLDEKTINLNITKII